MSMFVKKKQILAATLIVALAAAVTVNWYYSKPKSDASAKTSTVAEDTTAVASNAEYFASAKLEQKNVKDEIEEKIEKILKNENVSEDEKAKLTTLLEQFKSTLKAQTDCEEMIKAKIGGECVVIINGEKAQVIIENGKSNDSTILQITEIIENNTPVSPENLTIIEAK